MSKYGEFVVYNVHTTRVFKAFDTLSAARRSCTAANRRARGIDYDVAARSVYESTVVKIKTVKNLMTGEEVQIASNTPRSCDPSTELYWSM